MRTIDVAVVGAGPAGIAAALAAANAGARVAIIDEQSEVGGSLRWRVAPIADLPGTYRDLSGQPGVRLAAALAEGRPEVERVVDRQVTALATALRNAIHTVDPEVVVLGGFLGALLRHVGDRVETDVRAQTMAAMTDRLRIVPAALGRDVLVRGAAEIGFAELLRDAAMPAVPAAAPAPAPPCAVP